MPADIVTLTPKPDVCEGAASSMRHRDVTGEGGRYRFCCPGPDLLPEEAGVVAELDDDDGGMRIPNAAGLDLTSSILPFARLIPGTTQSPQLHCIPCHAYLPTLVLHFGHSRRPSSFPCSSSGRIQDKGSTK